VFWKHVCPCPWPGFLLAACAAWWVAGCREAPEDPRTVVSVVVDADEALREQLDHVTIDTQRSHSTWRRNPGKGEKALLFPFVFELVDDGRTEGALRVSGFTDGAERVRRVATLNVEARRNVAFRVLLSSGCAGFPPPCVEAEELTCIDCGGPCRSSAVDTSKLPPLEAGQEPLTAYEPLACDEPRDAEVSPPRTLDGGLDGGADGGLDDDIDGRAPNPEAGMLGPDADAEVGPEPRLDAQIDAQASDGGVSPFRLDAPDVVASSACAELTFARAQPAPETIVLTLEEDGAGHFASDPECLQTISAVSLLANESDTKVYYRATLPPGVTVERVALSAHHDGTNVRETIEVRRRARSLSVGSWFACVVLDDGGIQCWGRGAYGRLGRDSSFEAGPRVASALGLGSVSGSAQLKTNARHMYLLNDGALYAWGENAFGQLGQGTSDYQWHTSALALPALDSGVTRYCSGGFHGCAIKGGAAYCWGLNDQQQAGNVPDYYLAPRIVDGLASGVTDVAAGNSHTCALVAGAIKCWGDNVSGQLGNGSVNDSSTLVEVTLPVLAETKRVFAEGDASCALAVVSGNEQLYCWGQGFTPTPQRVLDAPSGIVDVMPVADVLCVRTTDSAYCKGANLLGLLGTGTRATSFSAFARVQLEGRVEDLSIGYFSAASTCAISDGLVYCWGFDEGPHLALSPAAGSVLSPTRTHVLDDLTEVSSLTLADSVGCAIHGSGALACWGYGQEGELGRGVIQLRKDAITNVPLQPTGMAGGVTQIAMSLDTKYVLAIQEGKAWAWGRNDQGQLGLGNTASGISVPHAVSILPAGASVSDVAAGNGHSCAIVQGATKQAQDGLYCWGGDATPWGYGDDHQGPLGDANEAHPNQRSLSAIQVLGPSANVTDVAASGFSTCAVVDGGVQCWGGFAASAVPEDVATLAPGSGANIVQVELGDYFACARSTTGNVYCFDTGGVPQDKGLTDAQQIAVGTLFACARRGTTSVACWSAPSRADGAELGQLGQGDTSPRAVPTTVPGLVAPVTNLAARGATACANDAEGWKCWGDNRSHNTGITPWVVDTPTLVVPWSNE